MARSIFVVFLACGPCLVMTLSLENGPISDVRFQDLMTLVQQQGKMIVQQAATLTALQNKVRDLTTQVNQQIGSVTNLTQRINTQVSFTARMTEVEVELTSQPFVFGGEVTNVGGGYNPATGIFTTPVAGLYMFYAQVMNHVNSSRVGWGIFTPHHHTAMLCLNGEDFAPVGRGEGDDSSVMNHANSPRVDWGIFTPSSMLCLNGVDLAPVAYDKASCLATAKLDKGRQVFVRKSSAGCTIEGNVYTSFSGLLLSADP